MRQCCDQTAEIIASLAGIGRNRIVPELTFLDARGVGALDRGQPSEGEALLRQGEQGASQEGGGGSSGGGAYWKPPKGSDGTPNESLFDVLVRMVQLLSLLETQYSGENVVIISPDSDNLSVLQAAVVGGSGGEDLTQHYKWAFEPGEVRMLQLNEIEFDDSPRSLPCPNPPQCR
jgi:broad specificity phosphatase PhoE